MRQEDKELLLQDLCGRLPYEVKCQLQEDEDTYIGTLHIIEVDNKNGHLLDFTESISGLNCQVYLSEIKPYLFPLSSMTEEQIEEAKTYFWKDVDYGKSLVDKGVNCFYPCFNILEFYHKNHLDYRGLIPMGLAIDASNLNVY